METQWLFSKYAPSREEYVKQDLLTPIQTAAGERVDFYYYRYQEL